MFEQLSANVAQAEFDRLAAEIKLDLKIQSKVNNALQSKNSEEVEKASAMNRSFWYKACKYHDKAVSLKAIYESSAPDAVDAYYSHDKRKRARFENNVKKIQTNRIDIATKLIKTLEEY
jgi:hypothetical protein